MSDTTPGEWLTVTEAAAALGVSSRAVQRRCKTGQLVARLVADKGGQHWEIGAGPDGLPLSATTATTPYDATATTPATQPNEGHDAPNDTHDRGNGGQTTPYEGNDATPATMPTKQTKGATEGTTPATEPNDDVTSRYVAHLESEVAHLRGQIEGHARAEAELRAALREALKAMPKMLPAPGEVAASATPEAQNGAQVSQPGEVAQRAEKRGFWSRFLAGRI
jgi:hypothetical protein